MTQVEGVKRGGRKSQSHETKTREKRMEKVEWKGYINVTLTEAQKRSYVAWINDPDIFSNALELALRDGYKLSVDYQLRENAYRASFYCQNADLPEAGFCLSVFAREYGTALNKLVYIHSGILASDWSNHLKAQLVDESW